MSHLVQKTYDNANGEDKSSITAVVTSISLTAAEDCDRQGTATQPPLRLKW